MYHLLHLILILTFMLPFTDFSFLWISYGSFCGLFMWIFRILVNQTELPVKAHYFTGFLLTHSATISSNHCWIMHWFFPHKLWLSFHFLKIIIDVLNIFAVTSYEVFKILARSNVEVQSVDNVYILFLFSLCCQTMSTQ